MNIGWRGAVALTMLGGIILLLMLQQGVAYFPWGVGLVAMILGLQIAFLMQKVQPPATKVARNLYLVGEFEQAAAELENHLMDKPDSLNPLVLLGNTYRQMGRLEASEQRLSEAVAYAPTHWMALYGLGRTMMVQGRYQQAADSIQAALQHGGRKTLRAELALAFYYADAPTEAKQIAAQAARRLNSEAYRILISNYLLYILATHEAERVLAKQMMSRSSDGLAYWQAQAERYSEMDYGQRVAADVTTIQRILEDDKA